MQQDHIQTVSWSLDCKTIYSWYNYLSPNLTNYNIWRLAFVHILKHGSYSRLHRSTVERSNTMSEVRGGGRKEQTHIQAAVAAQAQEGREELLHLQGQEGQLVQGKEQQKHFAGAAVEQYPTSKVRETQRRW